MDVGRESPSFKWKLEILISRKALVWLKITNRPEDTCIPLQDMTWAILKTFLNRDVVCKSINNNLSE